MSTIPIRHYKPRCLNIAAGERITHELDAVTCQACRQWIRDNPRIVRPVKAVRRKDRP
jgi:hypothetical protein